MNKLLITLFRPFTTFMPVQFAPAALDQPDPDEAEAANKRGHVYLKEGDFNRAIDEFSQAIQLKPDMAEAYYKRGLAYHKNGELDRAIADFDRAIHLDPNSAHTYMNRGNAYSDKGDPDRAIADHAQARRLDPIVVQLYDNRSSYMQPTQRNLKPEELNSYTKPIIGHKLLSVEKIDYTWGFSFGDDVSVWTEAAWRLIIEDHIAVTSEDHGQLFGLREPVDAGSSLLSRTIGFTVEAASIYTGDLVIDFGGQVQLQLLQLSSGYESWRFSIQGVETICMGGGEIAHFPSL